MIKKLPEFHCFVTLVEGKLYQCRMLEDGSAECIAGLISWMEVRDPVKPEFLAAANLALGSQLTLANFIPSNRTKAILLVEDDPTIQSLLKEALEMTGYSVWTADNGRHALEVIQEKGAPSLILLDLMMPEMDGSEFLNVLRQNPSEEMSKIPVIITTAAPLTGSGARKQANDFIKKPIDMDALIYTVKRYHG